MKAYQIIFYMLKKGEITHLKVYNFIRNFINFKLNINQAYKYPAVLMIEPTNYCNLKCPLCPTGNGSLTAPQGFMSFENYKKIIDETGSYLLHLNLWNFGEPFLNKDIYKMIEYARQKNIFTKVSTNGHFFEEKENVKKLINSDVDYLIISLDGVSQETFSAFRRNGNFKKVVSNISHLVEEKRRFGKKSPILEIQMLVMKHNEHEIPKMKALAKRLGVDNLKIKTVNIEIGFLKNIEKAIRIYLPKKEEFSRYKNESGELKRKNMKKSCKRLWLFSVVNWDGSVSPCCYDPNRKHKLGNAFEKGFGKVWNNEKYAHLRKVVSQNKESVEICKNCTGNFRDVDAG